MDMRKEIIYEEAEEDDDEEEESSEEESDDDDDEEEDDDDDDDDEKSESEDTDDNAEGTDSSTTSSESVISVLAFDNRPQRCAIIGQQCETFETPGLSATSVGAPSQTELDDVADGSDSSSATTVVAMPQTASTATSNQLATIAEEQPKVEATSSSSKSSINTGIYRNQAEGVANKARKTASKSTSGSSGVSLLLKKTTLEPYETRAVPEASSSSSTSLSPELYSNLLKLQCKETGPEITASGSRSNLNVSNEDTEGRGAAASVSSVNVGIYNSSLNTPASDLQKVDAAISKPKSSIFAEMYKNLRKAAKSETQKITVAPLKGQPLESTEIYRNHEMHVDSVNAKEFKKNFKSSESSMAHETSFITNICRALCKSEAPTVTSYQGIDASPSPQGAKEDVKSLGEVMQYLERCESTDDKLRVMCDKYSSMIQRQERLQLKASESMRQICDLRSEKEELETKHARVIKVRDRLKLVCQSLQQQIRELREESLGKGEEEEEKEEEERSATVVDTEAVLETERLRKENEELKEKLESTKEEAMRQEASIEEMKAGSRLSIAKDKEVALQMESLRKESEVLKKKLERTKEEAMRKEASIEEMKAESRLSFGKDKEVALQMESLRKESEVLKKKLESTKDEAMRKEASLEEMKAESLLSIEKHRSAVDQEVALQMERLRKENEALKKKLESTKEKAVRQGASIEEMKAKSRLSIGMNREMKIEHELEIERLKEEKVTLMTEVLSMVGRYESVQDEVDKKTRILEEREIELQTIREEEKFLKAEKEKYLVAVEKAEKDAESWNLLWKKSHRTLLDTNGKRREQRTELFEAGRKIVMLKALCKKLEEEQRSMKKTIMDLKSQRKESRFNVIEVKQTGDSLSKVKGNDSLCQLVRSYGDMYTNMVAKSEDNVNSAIAESFESLMGNLMGNGAMRGQFPRRVLGSNTEELVVVQVSQVDIEPSHSKPEKKKNDMAFVVNENFDTLGESSGSVAEKSESDAKTRADVLNRFTFCVANVFDIPPRRSVHFNSKVRFKRVQSNTEVIGRLRKTLPKRNYRGTTKDRRKDEVFLENLKDSRVQSGRYVAARTVVSDSKEVNADAKRSKSPKVMIFPCDTPSDCLSNRISPNSSEASPTTSEEYMNDTRGTRRLQSTKPIKDSEDSLRYNPQTNETMEEEISSFESLIENSSNCRQDVDTSTSSLDSNSKTEDTKIVETIDDSETCINVNCEEAYHEYLDVLEEVEEDLRNESDFANQEYNFEQTRPMPYSVSVLMSKNEHTTSVLQTKDRRTFLVMSTNKRPTSRTPTLAARHYNIDTTASGASSWATDVENLYYCNGQSSKCSVASFEESFTENFSGTAAPAMRKKHATSMPLTLDAEILSSNNKHSLECFASSTQSVKEKPTLEAPKMRKKLFTARPKPRGKERALSIASARRRAKNSAVSAAKSVPATAAPSAAEQFNPTIPETYTTDKDTANFQTENWTKNEEESNRNEIVTSEATNKHFDFALSKVAENGEKGEFLCHIKYRSKADKAQQRQQQEQRAADDVNLAEEELLVIEPAPESKDENHCTDRTNENNKEIVIPKKSSAEISHWSVVHKAAQPTRQDQGLHANLDLNRVCIQSCPIIPHDRECHQTRTEPVSKLRRTTLSDTPAGHTVSEIQREKGDCGLVRKCSSPSSRTVHDTTVQNGEIVTTSLVDRVSVERVGWPRAKSELLEVMKSKEWFMLDRDEGEGESVGEVKSKVAIIGHIRWLPLERFNFTEGSSIVATTGVQADDKKYYLVNKTGLEGQTSWAIGQTDWYRGVTALDTARSQDAATMRELCSFNSVVTVNTQVYRNEVVTRRGDQEDTGVETWTTDNDSLIRDVCKEAVDEFAVIQEAVDEVEAIQEAVDEAEKIQEAVDEVEMIQDAVDEVEAIQDFMDEVELIQQAVDEVEGVIQVAVDEYPDYDSHVKLARDEGLALLKKDKPRRNKLSSLMHKLF